MNAELLVSFTIFPSVKPRRKTDRADVAWSEVVNGIKNPREYQAKSVCPLISMSEYGDTIGPGYDCLRYAANVKRVFGCEFDYDGNDVPIERAAEILSQAQIRAALHTTPTKGHWRAIFPFSEPALPEKRAEYLGRANRALGGIASRESFALSQSFYVGRVRGTEYLALETEGRCIDLAADLEPLYPSGGTGAGNGQHDATSDADLRAAFERGENRYQAMLKLSSRWAARGMAVDDIEAALLQMLGSDTLRSVWRASDRSPTL
jgi:hypothetical protein